jgi:hypothetical protein
MTAAEALLLWDWQAPAELTATIARLRAGET